MTSSSVAPADALDRAYTILEAELDSLVAGWDRSAGLVDRARTISEGYTGPDRSRPATGSKKASRGKPDALARKKPAPKPAPRGPSAVPDGAPEPTPALDTAGRAAYLAYFAPRALAAFAAASTAPGFRFAFDAPVYDLGAGTGAAALWAAVNGATDVRLVDHAPGALAGAFSLLRRANIKDPKTIERAIDDAKVGDNAIAISAFTLGESILSQTLRTRDDEDAGLDRWLDLVTPAKRVLFVDAGDRHHARTLQRLRARALDRGMVVAGPCPHAGACPALEREKDWCHHRGTRALTPRLAAFANAVGRDEQFVSFSSLALIPRPTEQELEASLGATGILALAPPLSEKGRVRVPACGPRGIRFLQAKKRDRALFRELSAEAPGTRWSEPVSQDVRDQTLHLNAPDHAGWTAARLP